MAFRIEAPALDLAIMGTLPNSNPMPAALAAFVLEVDEIASEALAPAPLNRVAAALRKLVARDDWLPGPYARSLRDSYAQYLLYLDPASRFSVVSFVWGPGQGTPVHDHTTWGAVGVLRGAERSQGFVEHGQDEWQPRGDAVIHWPGMVETVSPEIGDVHQVSNAVDRVSISIHVYGGDIGTTSRHSFPADGGVRSFVSGYVSDPAAPPFSLSS